MSEVTSKVMNTLKKNTLRLSSAFALLSLVVSLFNAQASLACADGPCEACDGQKAEQKVEAKADKQVARKTESGRKVKCSKCAEHENTEAKPTSASKT
jgi:hypothetical protein